MGAFVFLSLLRPMGGCSVHGKCILSLTWAGRLRDVDQLDRDGKELLKGRKVRAGSVGVGDAERGWTNTNQGLSRVEAVYSSCVVVLGCFAI